MIDKASHERKRYKKEARKRRSAGAKKAEETESD
jgi:hypothetical protein